MYTYIKVAAMYNGSMLPYYLRYHKVPYLIQGQLYQSIWKKTGRVILQVYF